MELSRNGDFCLERHGKMTNQFCPFARTERESEPCGDWCPLFGEPTLINKDYVETLNDWTKEVKLKICHEKIFECDILDFTDNRGKH